MAFSPPVVGCLVEKRLQKGGVTIIIIIIIITIIIIRIIVIILFLISGEKGQKMLLPLIPKRRCSPKECDYHVAKNSNVVDTSVIVKDI